MTEVYDVYDTIQFVQLNVMR